MRATRVIAVMLAIVAAIVAIAAYQASAQTPPDLGGTAAQIVCSLQRFFSTLP